MNGFQDNPIGVKERMAVAPTFIQERIARDRLNLQRKEYERAEKDRQYRKSTDFSKRFDAELVQGITNTDRQAFAKDYADLESKWAPVYRDQKYKLTEEQQITLDNEITDIRLRQAGAADVVKEIADIKANPSEFYDYDAIDEKVKGIESTGFYDLPNNYKVKEYRSLREGEAGSAAWADAYDVYGATIDGESYYDSNGVLVVPREEGLSADMTDQMRGQFLRNKVDSYPVEVKEKTFEDALGRATDEETLAAIETYQQRTGNHPDDYELGREIYVNKEKGYFDAGGRQVGVKTYKPDKKDKSTEQIYAEKKAAEEGKIAGGGGSAATKAKEEAKKIKADDDGVYRLTGNNAFELKDQKGARVVGFDPNTKEVIISKPKKITEMNRETWLKNNDYGDFDELKDKVKKQVQAEYDAYLVEYRKNPDVSKTELVEERVPAGKYKSDLEKRIDYKFDEPKKEANTTTGTRVYNGQEYTIEELKSGGWTDEQIKQHTKAK